MRTSVLAFALSLSASAQLEAVLRVRWASLSMYLVHGVALSCSSDLTAFLHVTVILVFLVCRAPLHIVPLLFC